MSVETILQFCSPTLAGIKTGSLFQYHVANEEKLLDDMKHWNRFLRGKGLRMQPMRFSDGKALIYVYRPERLKDDLGHGLARKILKNLGYEDGCPESLICKLISRLAASGEFPHEIGLFLGYPPEDVFGFIKNKAKGYKWKGLWKVYDDVDFAKKKHALYEKCTSIYIDKWREGQPIERLTVAI